MGKCRFSLISFLVLKEKVTDALNLWTFLSGDAVRELEDVGFIHSAVAGLLFL